MDEDWTPQLGDDVVITEGPFEDFEGVIESINKERGKIRVLVNFYGRETPVELDGRQIRRLV